MKDLTGKTAFITGGASGIGLALATVLLEEGVRVVIADRDAAQLDEAREALDRLPGEYLAIPLDVTDRASWVEAADAAEVRFGALHLLFNNAGIGTDIPIGDPRYDGWDAVLAVNLGGVVNGVVTMLPRLRRHGQGGHVVNTASMAAIVPLGNSGGIYTASKFAVRGLSESLRLSLIPDRIGVTCLFPGLTRTRILEARKAKMRAEGRIDAATAGFIAAQESAMDPIDLARATIDAVRRNQPYVISHYEFADEIQAGHDRLMAAIRSDIPADPARIAFEAERCARLNAIAEQSDQW